MSLARQIVAGAGSLMACALITLLSMLGSQWVKGNPKTSFSLGVGLFVGCVGCLFFWLATREKKDALATSAGNIVGRDNLGKMIASVEHYHEAPTHASAPAPSPGLAISNLQSLGVREIVDDYFGTDGPVFTLRLQNMLKSTPIHSARSVCVALKFTNRYGQVEMAETAYWKGHFANQITIETGGIEEVVLGKWANHVWHYYSNPRKRTPSLSALRSAGFESPVQVGEIDLDNGDIELDVQVFSRPSGILLLEDHYRIDSRQPFLQRRLS